MGVIVQKVMRIVDVIVVGAMMLAFKQATSMSVLARVMVMMHANMHQIVLSIMSRVTVVIRAVLCKILPFMKDHVVPTIMVFLVSRLKMPPSEKDRVTPTSKIQMEEARKVANIL